jgi:HlyD family secretion protein
MAAIPNPISPVPNRPNVVSIPHRREKSVRSKWLRWGAAAALALAAIVGGLLWRTHLTNAISYETVPVERGSIQARVTATGNLNAVVDVLVSSQVSGNIKALYADWNSKVKKGQLVALIDPEIFQAQVDQANATYLAARETTAMAKEQIEKAKTDLGTAIANEKSSEAILAKDVANETNAKAQWERDTQANVVGERELQTQIVAQQDVDTAKANYDASLAQEAADQAQIDAAKQVIQSAQASVLVARSELVTAQEQERQAQAALQLAQVNLDHTRIMAPVDGTVIARRMDVGQTVASTLNPPTIFEIAQDLTKMQVDTNVDESDVGNVSNGQKATFVVDSYPDTTFHGIVADIRKAPISTQNVVTYDVVITVDNSDLKLFPGMTANVTILGAKLDDTLKVPNSVLRFRPAVAVLKKANLPATQAGKQQVYVLTAGTLQAVPVKFGLSDGKYTAVNAGELQPGAQVVVRATIGGGTGSSSSTSSVPMAPRM